VVSKEPVNMTTERVFCARHGEPYRAAWPKGYPTFVILLVKAIIDTPGALGTSGAPSRAEIEVALDEQPACCRVSTATLERVYEESKVGVLKRCNCCRLRRLGTPYKTAAAVFRHLCFHCVIHNAVEVN
jgi:hypothetical protein